MWALIELRRPVIHCENTIFIYYDDLSKYMKVEGATSNDVFDYLFDVGVEKFISKKGRNIFMNYLKNGI